MFTALIKWTGICKTTNMREAESSSTIELEVHILSSNSENLRRGAIHPRLMKMALGRILRELASLTKRLRRPGPMTDMMSQ